jgi:hypothetical protein
MGQLDNALRQQATPFLGQVAGYNRSDQSDIDVTAVTAVDSGDLLNLSLLNAPTNVPLKNNLIRILRPQFVHITAAYLTLSITTANAETSPKFYITVGTGFSSGVTPATPTDAQILDIHKRLKGDANPFTTPNGLAGTITVYKLNILSELPAPSSANFNEFCFVVGIHFLQTPLNSTGFKLNKFGVDLAGVILHG